MLIFLMVILILENRNLKNWVHMSCLSWLHYSKFKFSRCQKSLHLKTKFQNQCLWSSKVRPELFMKKLLREREKCAHTVGDLLGQICPKIWTSVCEIIHLPKNQFLHRKINLGIRHLLLMQLTTIFSMWHQWKRKIHQKSSLQKSPTQ